jgi:hypothetical protein
LPTEASTACHQPSPSASSRRSRSPSSRASTLSARASRYRRGDAGRELQRPVPRHHRHPGRCEQDEEREARPRRAREAAVDGLRAEQRRDAEDEQREQRREGQRRGGRQAGRGGARVQAGLDEHPELQRPRRGGPAGHDPPERVARELRRGDRVPVARVHRDLLQPPLAREARDLEDDHDAQPRRLDLLQARRRAQDGDERGGDEVERDAGDRQPHRSLDERAVVHA